MKRGWIMSKDGNTEEVALYVLKHEHITWPPTMHVKEPGEPIKYFTGEDMYRRHEVIEGAAYLYLQDTEANKDVPTDLVDWVRKQVEDSQGV